MSPREIEQYSLRWVLHHVKEVTFTESRVLWIERRPQLYETCTAKGYYCLTLLSEEGHRRGFCSNPVSPRELPATFLVQFNLTHGTSSNHFGLVVSYSRNSWQTFRTTVFFQPQETLKTKSSILLCLTVLIGWENTILLCFRRITILWPTLYLSCNSTYGKMAGRYTTMRPPSPIESFFYTIPALPRPRDPRR